MRKIIKIYNKTRRRHQKKYIVAELEKFFKGTKLYIYIYIYIYKYILNPKNNTHTHNIFIFLIYEEHMFVILI